MAEPTMDGAGGPRGRPSTSQKGFSRGKLSSSQRSERVSKGRGEKPRRGGSRGARTLEPVARAWLPRPVRTALISLQLGPWGQG